MSIKRKYTLEERINILHEYYAGDISQNELFKKYNISRNAFKDWEYRYMRYGIDGLKNQDSTNVYTQEFKEKVVSDYFSGKYTKTEIAKKYELRSRSSLNDWIKKYNNHNKINSILEEKDDIMIKKTSISAQEKFEIAMYCVNNGLNYKKASMKYGVSYQRVYSWVRKYKTGGKEAFRDKRRSKEELTPEEIIQQKIKDLEMENMRLKAENLLLKKLDELERGRS